jgi:ferric-dicitrate binding protein FerR (iron transport regulator)
VKFAAAAVLAGCCAMAAYFMNTRVEAPQVKLAAKETPVNTILPGSNKAMLKLAGGEVIVLDSAQNGVLNVSGEDSVQKTGNGQLVYTSKAARQTPGSAAINVLVTPKGGTYQVTLSDGTRVWLNSASSLTFPAAFQGHERRVKLDGEAFFEVAKNREVPFYVDVKETTVRVYGTQFNIAAYNDEKTVKTTLITGSVQVTKNDVRRMLVPGQQATTIDGSSSISVGEVNVMNAMSWKNGYFVFDDENINGIMKKVSRWYDVSVEYRGTFNNQKFGGSFYRYKSIDELLHYLEKLGSVHFEISGRRIIVMN